MKKKILGFALAGILLLGGCGSSGGGSYATKASSTSYSPAAANGFSADYEMEESYDMSDGAFYTEAPAAAQGGAEAPQVGESSETAQKSSRKLIRNVNLNVETKSFDDLLAMLEQRTKELGGYVESSYSFNGSSYENGKGVRNANMTIRIPADQMDAFLSDVSLAANVVSRNENVSDVTLTYVDLESHRNALRTEEDSLIKMMEAAESIEDLITIESRLSDVRYQLESM